MQCYQEKNADALLTTNIEYTRRHSYVSHLEQDVADNNLKKHCPMRMKGDTEKLIIIHKL